MGLRDSRMAPLLAEMRFRGMANIAAYLLCSGIDYRDGVITFYFHTSMSFLMPLAQKMRIATEKIASEVFGQLVEIEYQIVDAPTSQEQIMELKKFR